MPWSDIEKAQLTDEQIEKQRKQQREKQLEIAKNYAHVFTEEIGQKVLSDLTNKFIMGNDMPLDAKNPEYQAGYHDGEASIVKYIIHMIKVAQTH